MPGFPIPINRLVIGAALVRSQVAARVDIAGWMRFALNPCVLAVVITAAAGAGLLAGLPSA